MNEIIVKDPSKEQYEIATPDNYIFEKSAKFTVKKSNGAIYVSSGATQQTLTLKNVISVSYAGDDKKAVYGIANEHSYGTAAPETAPVMTVCAMEGKPKLTVSATFKMLSFSIYGIAFQHTHEVSTSEVGDGTLVIGAEGESYLQSISVNGSNPLKNAGKSVSAYGIYSEKDIDIRAVLAGSMTVKATSSSNIANAYGVRAKDSLSVQTGITSSVQVSASGYSPFAVALYAANANTLSGDLTGKISSTAKAAGGNALAYGVFSRESSITHQNGMAKSISIKSTVSSGTYNALGYGYYAKKNVTLAKTGEMSVVAESTSSASAIGVKGGTSVNVSSAMSGTATVKASALNSATAYVLFAEQGAVSVSGAVEKKLSVTASGKYEKAETAVFKGNGVALGAIVANLSATAKSGAKNADACIILAEASGDANVTVKDNISGKLTVKASSASGNANSGAIRADADILIQEMWKIQSLPRRPAARAKVQETQMFSTGRVSL